MAKISCHLNIEFTEVPGENLCGWLKTENAKLREVVESLGYELEPRGNDEYFICKIREPAGSEKIEVVRQAILKAGFVEGKSTVIPKGLRRTHFAFKYVRSFMKSDIEGAPLLLFGIRGLQRIADWKETAESGYVLRANSRLKNKLDVGWVETINVPYVSEPGREALKEGDLAGIAFIPAIFDEPVKAMKKLFMLTSSITLPPALLPVKNSAGEVVSLDDAENGHHWDDGCYMPPVLKYDRKQLEEMESFDIAKTREQIGGLPQHYRHQCIVSQRFRQHVEAMKVRGAAFLPVELIEDNSTTFGESHP